jgi:hypothetical protein
VLWDPQHGMSQPQFEEYLHSGKVERLIVVQESNGQFWLAIRLVRDPNLWHLVTRRAQDAPRMFPRIDVLMARLEGVGPLKKPFWVVPLHARITRRELLRL